MEKEIQQFIQEAEQMIEDYDKGYNSFDFRDFRDKLFQAIDLIRYYI